MDNELTDEEIAGHFSAMDDSVDLINATVADDSEAKRTMSAVEVKLMVTRNTDHLEIQAEKDWYKDSSNSKTSYDDAVTAGKAYVAAE
jgi:hypothetical protein